MPIFDYECPLCHHSEVDKMVGSSNTAVACPACGAVMNRLVSATGSFLLRGDGFYKMHGKELIHAFEKKHGLEGT